MHRQKQNLVIHQVLDKWSDVHEQTMKIKLHCTNFLGGQNSGI